MLQFFKKSGQREKGRATPSPTSPGRSPKFQNTLANGDVPPENAPGVEYSPVAVLTTLQQEELNSEGNNRPVPQHSRLSKTISEVLAEKGALGYFIQYLDARDGLPLIKFWLDAESFRAAATRPPAAVSDRGDQVLPVNENRLQPSAFCDNDKLSLSTDSGSVFESPLHSSGSTNDITIGNTLEGGDNKKIVPLYVQSFAPSLPSVNCSLHDVKFSSNCNEAMSDIIASSKVKTESCSDHWASPEDVVKNDRVSISCSEASSCETLPEQTSVTSTKKSNSLRVSSMQLAQATVDDALRIFNKYISHEASHPIQVPDTVRDKLVSAICSDVAQVDPNCFLEVQAYVVQTLEKEYFNDFLRSDFHCKHQIDVLTSGSVLLSDILFNETALFYFMEYMEQEGNQNLLEFWLAALNFEQHLKEKEGNYDATEAQNDAIVLYEKYFSLQATSPLGFSDKIRFSIEQNICREGGPLPECFRIPADIVFRILEKNYLRPFLSSELYFKYLSELINTIQASPALQSRNRKAGSECRSECGSECSISIHNTLLAMEDTAPPRKIIRNMDDREMSIDSRQLYDPDSLWRRRHKSGLSFGRINELGRFETDVEPEPDRKEESRITRVVKKLVNMEEDKAKEEMAWQIAEMIVKDITNLTLGGNEQVQS